MCRRRRATNISKSPLSRAVRSRIPQNSEALPAVDRNDGIETDAVVVTVKISLSASDGE